MRRILNLLIFLFLSCIYCKGQQVIADFSVQDSTCGAKLIINNLSQNALTYYWNFCGSTINTTPVGVNIGNPGGGLNGSVRIEVIKEGNDYYGFIVNHWNGTITRYYFGSSFINSPISVENLGSFGITYQAEGIQIKNDNGTWYAIVVGGSNSNSKILRLNFGNSLANTPSVDNLGNVGNINFPHGITLFQYGGKWYAFIINAFNNSVTRLYFGTSLSNTPSGINLGTLTSLDYPTGIFITQENNQWYGFITSSNNNSVIRLSFGNSFTNIPTDQVILSGNGLSRPFDIKILKDCNKVIGIITNNSSSKMLKLDFTGGVSGSVTATGLGNMAGFSTCEGISDLIRIGDSIYFFVANAGNSISRIQFSSCHSSIIASTNEFSPPVFSFNSLGNNPISLCVDEGLPTQDNICKNVTVSHFLPSPSGYANSPVCAGNSIKFFADTIPNVIYNWSGPANFTSSIQNPIVANATLSNGGTYWLHISSGNCASDSIPFNVKVVTSVTVNQETTICQGDTNLTPGNYFSVDTLTGAANCDSIIIKKLHVISSYSDTLFMNNCEKDAGLPVGIHYRVDSLKSKGNCDSVVFKIISVHPTPIADAGNDLTICKGTKILLTGNGDENEDYTWTQNNISFPLNTNPEVEPIHTTKYFLQITDSFGCKNLDSIIIYVTDEDNRIAAPNAFSPNGDGINDLFKIFNVEELIDFDLRIYNRWGELIFHTNSPNQGWDGRFLEREEPVGTYVYYLTATSTHCAQKIFRKGNLTLLR